MGIDGKGAIVTGGSLGIGAAIALDLAHEGCNVAINYRRHDTEAKEIVKEIESMGRKALAIQADVSSHSDAQNMVETVVKEFGKLDILVCNAGINWDGVIWKMTEKQWDQVINVNLKGYFNYNKAAALVFKDQKGGKIVNISSINGIRGKFGQANYSASKGGEIAMSKTLAKELGKFNVNVNVVAPGMVMTEMARNIPAEFLNMAIDETVLGRIATADDVAHLVTFLCSDKARHITGEVFKIDGGQYI
ncbi:MAG: SDR family oxidoreductase [candidate division Zixibacteria bacterium]|nr:SDR family oxidoreductase [candidate division Zixibacteria bacterium]MBU1471193.1 SDR family oxidoreductase [candidate division Zixibacteria bacterium]MBU2626715.1 SDR family oxidoreductase [candidate division Zixibacteria bacterium]